MAMRLLVFLLLLLLFSTYPASLMSSTENGDVRLTGRSSTLIEGTLQIYLDGQWGTVCSVGFNIYAAHAACRELGYVKALHYDNAVNMGFPSVNASILLSNVNCPTVNEPQYQGQLHLLRCKYDKGNDNCDHSQDVGIRCSNTSLSTSPYDTQVWLKQESLPPEDTIVTPSSGVLRVNLNGEWGLVCYDGFTRISADSVCLQNGFTNAIGFVEHTESSQELVWLNDVNCASLSSCFYKCFDYPSDPISCPENSVVSISCTFNSSKSDSTPGSSFTCDYRNIKHHHYLARLVISVTVSLCFVVVILIVIIIITCAVCTCCPLHMYRKRRTYRSII